MAVNGKSSKENGNEKEKQSFGLSADKDVIQAHSKTGLSREFSAVSVSLPVSSLADLVLNSLTVSLVFVATWMLKLSRATRCAVSLVAQGFRDSRRATWKKSC